MDGMRVERCPTCGARYNVTHLAPGARFACRRCEAVVLVGGEALAAERAPRWGLAFAGVVAFGAALLAVGTGRAAGESTGAWTHALPDLPRSDAVSLTLLAAAGLLSVLAAFGRRGMLVLGPLAVAVLALLARSQGPESGVLGSGAPDPALTWARVALGAAAVALASGRAEGRGAARALAIGGALGLVAALASRPVAGGEGTTLLSLRADEVARFGSAVWRAEGTTVAWDPAVPLALQAAAAALALLAVALPARGAAGLVRFLARTTVVLTFAALVAPHLVAAWTRRDEVLGRDGARVASQLAQGALFEGGLALWLLGACVAATFVQGQFAPRPEAPPLARSRSTPWHAATVVASLATLLLLVNPTSGVFAHRWPWQIPWPFAIDEALVATALLGALAVAATVTTVAPPARRGGALLAVAAGLAACAGESGAPMLGVPRGTMPILLAAAAGALVARRGRAWRAPGRSIPAIAGGATLVLLLWPRDASDVLGAPRGPGWSCTLTNLLGGLAEAGMPSGPAVTALLEPSAMVALLAAGAAFAALLSVVTGPRPSIAWAVGLLWTGVALHPVAHAVVTDLATTRAPAQGTPLEIALGSAGRALERGIVPAWLAVFAAVLDATRRVEEPSPGGGTAVAAPPTAPVVEGTPSTARDAG